MADAVQVTIENGYRLVETSDKWRQLCSPLPCFWLVRVPGYPTKIIEDEINGKPVVIQIWKGWFPQILGKNYPGGIGVEVGIYERVKGRGFAAKRPDFYPKFAWNFLFWFSKHAGKRFWWPVTELNEVELSFINPVTNEAMFHAGPEKSYWVNKWIDRHSYDDYRTAHGKRWPRLPAWFPKNSTVPKLSKHFVLEYKINGKTYPRW